MNLRDKLRTIYNVEYKPEPSYKNEEYIPTYIITNMNSSKSMYAARRCHLSITKTNSKLDATFYPGADSTTFAKYLTEFRQIENADKLSWTWPNLPNAPVPGTKLYTNGRSSISSGHIKAEMYNTINHMRLWQTCVELNRPIVILQQDAQIVREISQTTIDELFPSKFTQVGAPALIGLNYIDPDCPDPRQVDWMVEKIGSHYKGVRPVPTINGKYDNSFDEYVSKSAYYITPYAARKILDNVRRVGMMPVQCLLSRDYHEWVSIVVPRLSTTQQGYSPKNNDD